MFERIEKDFAEITADLDAFVQQFDEEYTCTVGGDFEALLDTVQIVYAVFMSDRGAKTFYANFVQRFPLCAGFDIFTLSFMHELGHLETEWMIEDDTEQRNKIMTDNEYYDLYNERIATDWAGHYLTAHLSQMKIWEKNILTKIKKVLDGYPDV